jgi:hypothetical protein
VLRYKIDVALFSDRFPGVLAYSLARTIAALRMYHFFIHPA